MRRFKLFLFVFGVFALLGLTTKIEAGAPTTVELDVKVILDGNESSVGAYNDPAAIIGSTYQFDDTSITGHEFLYWVVNGALRQDLPLDHTFTVQSKMNLIAIFEPTDGTHPIIIIDTNGKLLSHQYLEVGSTPTTPTIPYSKPWSTLEGFVEIGEYEDEEPTVHTALPNVNGPKVYVAKYELAHDTPSHMVKLDNVQVGEGNYKVGDVVELSNTDPNFKYYIDQDTGAILSFDRNYSFTMLNGARNILSIIEGDSIDTEPLVSMHHDLNLRMNYHSFLGHFELPLGYEAIEYGLELTENGVVKRQPATSFNEDTNEFLFSIPSSMNYQNVKVYLTAQYGNDAPITVYNKSRYELNFKAIAPHGSPVDHLYIDGSIVDGTAWQAVLVGGEGYQVTKTIIAEPFSSEGYNYYATSSLYKEKQADRITDANERTVTYGRSRVIYLNDTIQAWPIVDMTYTVNFAVTAPANETNITRTPDTIYVIGNFNNWTEETAQPLTLNTLTGKHEGTVEISSVYSDGVPTNSANGMKLEYKFLAQKSWGAAEVIGNNREYVLTLQQEFGIHDTVYEWRYEFIVYTSILNNDYAPNVWKGYGENETMVQAYSPHEPRWYKFTTDRYGQGAYIKNIHDNYGNSEESVAIPLDITNRYIKILAWNNSISRFDISVHPTKESLPTT